jgi:acyl-CoA hydrolase
MNAYIRPVSGDVIPLHTVQYLEWVSGADKRKIVLHTKLPSMSRVNLSSAESESFYAEYMQYLLEQSGVQVLKTEQDPTLLQDSVAKAAQEAKGKKYVAISYGLECAGVGGTMEEAAEKALESAWGVPCSVDEVSGDTSNQVLVAYTRNNVAREGVITLSSVRMTVLEV